MATTETIEAGLVHLRFVEANYGPEEDAKGTDMLRLARVARAFAEEIDALRARAEAAEERERGLREERDRLAADLVVAVGQKGGDCLNYVMNSLEGAFAVLRATPPPPASREAAVIAEARQLCAEALRRSDGGYLGGALAMLPEIARALDGAGEPKEESNG